MIMISNIYFTCWRQYWLKLFNKTFLVKGKSDILNYFLLYDVIILTWKTCIISSDPPYPMIPLNLHFSIVSEARNACRVTFVEKPLMKIMSFQNGKHGYLMQYSIRQSFERYCCKSKLKLCLLHHLKPLNWFYINKTVL